MELIYLDNNATTQVDPQVRCVCDEYMSEKFGNPASVFHRCGKAAAEAVEAARQNVAELISARADEIIFTSGATESNNLAILGVADMYRQRGRHIITSQTEHTAVIEPCRYLERNGWTVTYLKPDSTGMVRPQQLEEAISDETILISFMLANNETGTINPVAAIGEIAKRWNVIFHCDAAQAIGKIPVDVDELGVDLLSFSGHKFYAPKGVGGLYVCGRGPRVRLSPQVFGGGQERGLRSGTLNVPAIAAMGKACEIVVELMAEEGERIKNLRDRFEQLITAGLDGVTVNGHRENRLPNTLNLSFSGVEGETISIDLGNSVAVSTGSACSSGSSEPSYVLKAMDVSPELLSCAIRFSLGRFTTADEIELAAKKVLEVVKNRRKKSHSIN